MCYYIIFPVSFTNFQMGHFEWPHAVTDKFAALWKQMSVLMWIVQAYWIPAMIKIYIFQM